MDSSYPSGGSPVSYRLHPRRFRSRLPRVAYSARSRSSSRSWPSCRRRRFLPGSVVMSQVASEIRREIRNFKTTCRVHNVHHRVDRRTSPARQNGRCAGPQPLREEPAEYSPPCAGDRHGRDASRASRARNRMLGRSGFPTWDSSCLAAYRPSSIRISELAHLHNHRPRARHTGGRAYNCTQLSSLDRLRGSNSKRRNGMFP